MAFSSLLPATCSLSLLPSSTRRIYDDDFHRVSFSRIAYPTLTTSFSVKSAHYYNVQIIVEDDDPEEKIINRFRIEVIRARVFHEYKRKRFFENKQDKIKRKGREAAIRDHRLIRNPRPRFPWLDQCDSFDFPNKEKDDDSEDEDNWEIFDVDVPYA